MSHDHDHSYAGHTHASGDCACSAPLNDSFSDEEELDNFDLYTPLRIVDELPASYGVGSRYLIEWEDLPLGGITVESANGLGSESKRLLEEWEVRKAEIAEGKREAFGEETWRKAMKVWNGKSNVEKSKIVEARKAERLEKNS